MVQIGDSFQSVPINNPEVVFSIIDFFASFACLYSQTATSQHHINVLCAERRPEINLQLFFFMYIFIACPRTLNDSHSPLRAMTLVNTPAVG